MTYDPAWDMPKVNWRQQGSFEIPEIPPIYEPDAEPLICLPAINRYWLPYVMGALDQLRNPSSWIVADDTAMYDTLARVSKLKEMIGVGVPCMSFMLRFVAESCQLQESTDGGSTWVEVEGWSSWLSCIPPQTQIQFTEGCELEESFDSGSSWSAVPGWDANFSACVQANTPIIGLPPNPGDETHDGLACSIADYLANEIILQALSGAVAAIQDNLTLLSFGASVLTLIPEFVLVKLGYDAISIIYTAVAEGTLSDYESALTDGTLWNDVVCAIFNAIRTDGYVTPSNFGAIVSNISSISYSHSDVIAAIVAYVDSLGATGLAQLSQRAGLNTGATCASCLNFCHRWGPDGTDFCNGDWYRVLSDPNCGSCGSNSWTTLHGDGFYCLIIENQFPEPRTVGSFQLTYVGVDFEYFHVLFYNHVGTLIMDLTSATWTGTLNDVAHIEVNIQQNEQPATITSIEIAGSGVNPWGTDNCI